MVERIKEIWNGTWAKIITSIIIAATLSFGGWMLWISDTAKCAEAQSCANKTSIADLEKKDAELEETIKNREKIQLAILLTLDSLAKNTPGAERPDPKLIERLLK